MNLASVLTSVYSLIAPVLVVTSIFFWSGLSNWLLSGFDRYRSDNCLTMWDINPDGISSPALQSMPGGGTTSLTVDKYKRFDLIMHNQQVWKPVFDYGMNEQCHSLTWFKPNERLFPACTTQHTTKTIKIYNSRGQFFIQFN